MRKLSIFSIICVACLILPYSGIADTFVGGQVSGIWNAAGSPYYVLADLEVPSGSNLVIEPGVQVKFTGHFRFIAHGNISAVGALGDSIYFTHSLPYPEYTWAGLNLLSTEGPPEFAYCVFEYGDATTPYSAGGAIHVYHTPVNIRNCRITNNKAAGNGGAIWVSSPSALIEIYDNIIVNNQTTEDGGAIYLDNCANTMIYSNHIEDNWADDGGGLYYYYSNGILEDNEIIHNHASQYSGGGMLLDHSSPSIQYNKINLNISASSSGTGIYIHHYSSPAILYNELWANNYNAMFCGDNCSPEVTNNTIYENGGYAIRTYQNSHPYGKNNIIIGNNSVFYISSGCSVSMTYSDIQGGWTGIGNIWEPPLFLNPVIGDLQLSPSSPCIDAGDPASALDPDGTIADQGAHYFDQSTPQGTCTVDLTPFGTPIILPPSGGTVWYGVSVINSPDYYNIFDGWINLVQPDGQTVPVLLRTDLYLAPGGSIVRNMSLTLSSSAMPGTYTLSAFVGDNPTIIESFDSFTFEKAASGDSYEGESIGYIFDGEVTEQFTLKGAILPEETKLIGHYPEPFNPSATIQFSLAKDEFVSLEVYSITGQKVKSLLNRKLSAGNYVRTFNAEGLSSGLYLYVLKAGDYCESQKMILLK